MGGFPNRRDHWRANFRVVGLPKEDNNDAQTASAQNRSRRNPGDAISLRENLRHDE